MVDIPLKALLTDKGSVLDFDPKVTGHDYFSVQLRGTSLLVQARGFVGLIPLNERVALEVVPRVPIGNLARLLRIAGFATRTLEGAAQMYDREQHELPSLRDFLATALVAELGPIEAYGRMREYRERTERTAAPRGRFLMGAPETQMAAIGASTQVRASWFERTADTAANRCLKLAVWLLANDYAHAGRLSGEQRWLVRRLNALYQLFEDAELDPYLKFLSDPFVTGVQPLPATRVYYRAALDVALTIVSRSSVALEQRGLDVRLPSLILDLGEVFEGYVRGVLTEQISEGDTDLVVEDGNAQGKKPLFDERPSVEATPDIVMRDNASKYVLVVLDAKYKPANGKPDRDDLNQIITYAASFRSPRVVVVQPRSHDSDHAGLTQLGTMGRLKVFQYVINLGSADLVREEKAFGHAITQLARGAGNPLDFTV